MQIQSVRWSSKRGWEGQLPELDSPSTLVLAFGASELFDDPTAITDLARAYPTSVVAGCSSAGEIFQSEVVDSSLSVAVVRFEQTKLRAGMVHVSSAADSHAAGKSLGAQLSGEGLKYVLVLSDGLNVNGTALVAGLNEVFGPGVIITGGLAGDGSRFKRTWVIDGGAPKDGVIAAVGFYGERLHVGHGSRGGWDIFGPERSVTRAEGNVLHELDGRPALALYKEYLGDRAAGLPATGLLFPLAIRSSDSDTKRLVRTILAVDEAAQTMTFAGDIPQGWKAQLMKANFDRLVGGAADAAALTARSATAGPALSIAISCVGRRLVLGERTEEEVEAALDALPKGTIQVGFYSYGELSPAGEGSCDLHNQTMTLTAIQEA